MNGDVNGTMEEPKEVSPPIAEVNKPEQKVTSADCDDNKNICENSINSDCNYKDSELKNGSSENGQPDCSENENSKDSNIESSAQCPIEGPAQEHEQDLGDSCIENHCENSNESNPESTTSSLAKSETSKLQEKEDFDPEKDDDKADSNQDEVNLDEDLSTDEVSIVSGEPRAEDTVSIDSDLSLDERDETSQEIQCATKSNDIIVLDNENRPLSSNNSEVHEINSDNENDNACLIEKEKKPITKPKEEKAQLRRSSRTIKRKKYIDDLENKDESDIEEVELEDPLKRKSRPIVINDTKALVAMAVKNMKSNHGNNQRKEPTVVIIDTNSSFGKTTSAQHTNKTSSSSNSISAQNLYQSIVARGTTVTPVSSKSTASTQATQNAQSNILPSLTDDMFVVEAPSFIVPYVYEKPSVKPFREFVDKLGKVLEEERIKEEEKEKDKHEKEKQDRRANGEEVPSEDETKDVDKKEELEEENEKMKKKVKKEQRRRRNEEDDASWDGESISESDDEVMSDEDDKIVVKDKAEPIEQMKDMATLTADKICSNKSSGPSSMDCTLGKFFINIGLNLVQEFVQTDLLKQQNRKLYKEKKSGQSTKATENSIAQLKKNLELSKENNEPYSFPQKKCEYCSFRSESNLVLQQHLETPHMKNNVYKCNFCTFEIRSPHDILYHMEAEHNVRGKLERAPSYHQCSNCPFEDNGKGKLARHLIACAKKFKPDTNLAPPIDWEPPAKIPKIAKPRNSMMGNYHNAMNRSQMAANIRAPINVSGLVPGVTGYRPRVGSPMATVTRAATAHVPPRILRGGGGGGGMVRHASPAPLILPNNLVVNNAKPKSVHQPSISITPLPRQPQPAQQQQQQPSHGNSKSQFVICEICDGYIKDLEQLRNHMQWIHKVKIHPKMIYNRPPLNCQKCQFRFFTDQGLERHLLGSHGLVTSSMQEAANKGKDAGRCPVCGRVYQWKLLNHVARDHSLTLKPAHLSYKCTVCTATFGMYKLFENHVYSAHSVVAKRVMDKTKGNTPQSKGNDTLLKPLKINDEITIIPQPVKSASAAKDK